MTAGIAYRGSGAGPRTDKATARPRDPRVSVIVPAKNEIANIAEVLPYLAQFHEVIVVVGEGDDHTADAARAALPWAMVIQQTRQGKGNALICGFEKVTGDVIVTFDIDGSADPNEIPCFVEALTDGADLAKGSRFTPGGGSEDITAIRGLGNSGLNLLANGLTKARFTDLCYGFNAFWADQLPRLDLPDASPEEGARLGDGFEIEAMIIGRFAHCGAKITEVPSYEHHRYHGETNLKPVRDGVRVLRTLLADRLRARRFGPAAGRRRSGATPRPPRWMRVRPNLRALDVLTGPDFPDEIHRSLEHAWLAYCEVPAAIRMAVAIAAAEVGNNIIEHAGRGAGVRVRMDLEVLADQVRVEFIDDGLPADIDLSSVRMPDVMAESGRGLALAQAFLGELSHRYDGERNHWTLVSETF